MAVIDFVATLHNRTGRDYRQRVLDHDKAVCATVAKRWGPEYWDGERCYGYGGMRYDGRWRPVAEAMARHYQLKAGDRLLDVGCGKGFLLYEFTQVVPGVEVVGLDISHYALDTAKDEVKPLLYQGTATALPFADASFDVVISLGTLHNLAVEEAIIAAAEIERVGRGPRKYIMVESFRNEKEKVNLLYWQLTCQSFLSPESWAWLLAQAGYHGDHGFIFFT